MALPAGACGKMHRVSGLIDGTVIMGHTVERSSKVVGTAAPPEAARTIAASARRKMPRARLILAYVCRLSKPFVG